MKNNFKAANLILSGIWYAKISVSYIDETIDFDKIHEFEQGIIPSENETKLVNFAQDLYYFKGEMVDFLFGLDSVNQKRVVKALNALIGA